MVVCDSIDVVLDHLNNKRLVVKDQNSTSGDRDEATYRTASEEFAIEDYVYLQ